MTSSVEYLVMLLLGVGILYIYLYSSGYLQNPFKKTKTKKTKKRK